MLSIRFNGDHEWWVSGKIFDRLFHSALDNGMSPNLEHWRDVANANGGLNVTRKEASDLFTSDDAKADVRAFAESVVRTLLTIFDNELRHIIEGKTVEETPIDWQGYK